MVNLTEAIDKSYLEDASSQMSISSYRETNSEQLHRISCFALSAIAVASLGVFCFALGLLPVVAMGCIACAGFVGLAIASVIGSKTFVDQVKDDELSELSLQWSLLYIEIDNRIQVLEGYKKEIKSEIKKLPEHETCKALQAQVASIDKQIQDLKDKQFKMFR
jgi:hypothetical protein